MAYCQPGTEPVNYDPGLWVMLCPYCSTRCRVIGSNGFFFRCDQKGINSNLV